MLYKLRRKSASRVSTRCKLPLLRISLRQQQTQPRSPFTSGPYHPTQAVGPSSASRAFLRALGSAEGQRAAAEGWGENTQDRPPRARGGGRGSSRRHSHLPTPAASRGRASGAARDDRRRAGASSPPSAAQAPTDAAVAIGSHLAGIKNKGVN